MVYESDFYTTRRPYSRHSPTISSYSVTTFPKIPYIAVKRITVPITVAPHGKVRRSVIRGALDRIQHRSRPHVGASAEDDFLNARASVNFDDTVHSIRAQTAALLKRVHTPIPHAVRPLPISSIYKYIETPIPERIESSAYIDLMLLSPNERVRRDIVPMSHYPQTTHHRNLFGGGRLACVSFAAGRVYPRRKLMLFDENNYRNVRNDVQYLSYYNKTRAEVEKQHPKIKLEEEAKLRREPIVKPAHPTHTHVSFQTPLKTEEPIIKPIKPTEPLYSDDSENVFQKEEEIDAWLTHQKKKKSKKDAENNEDLLNEELAAKEEALLTQAERIQPEAEFKSFENEANYESTTEISEPEKPLETLSQEPEKEAPLEETPLEETQELEEEIISKETDTVEKLNEAEVEPKVEDVPAEVEEPIAKEEEISSQNEETTVEKEEEKENVEQEEVSAKPTEEDEEQAEEQQEQVEEIEETEKQEEFNEEEAEQQEVQIEEKEEQIQHTDDENVQNEQEQSSDEKEEQEQNVETEEDVEAEEEKDTQFKETEVEAESVKDARLEQEDEVSSKAQDKDEITNLESEREEIADGELADKSVAGNRKASEDNCSTLEHKDNDGPKSDTEISDLEEDECAAPEKVSVKDTLNPAVDTNLDDSSLVDDVFEAPEASAENKLEPGVTTDEECEEDSE